MSRKSLLFHLVPPFVMKKMIKLLNRQFVRRLDFKNVKSRILLPPFFSIAIDPKKARPVVALPANRSKNSRDCPVARERSVEQTFRRLLYYHCPWFRNNLCLLLPKDGMRKVSEPRKDHDLYVSGACISVIRSVHGLTSHIKLLKSQCTGSISIFPRLMSRCSFC